MTEPHLPLVLPVQPAPVLDVDVLAGNQHAANHAAPGLWALLDRIGRDRAGRACCAPTRASSPTR